MASSIGSGNYFSDINVNRAAKGPGAEELRSAQNVTGATASNAKSSVGKTDGVTLSPKAQHVHKSGHEKQLEEHAADFAEMTGATFYEAEDAGRESDREVQNHDRNVEQEALHQVVSPQGVVQQLTDEDNGRLKEMDSSLHCKLHLNSDVPRANFEAASKVMETRRPKDLADLKFGPEAEAAVQPELKPVGLHCEVMDITVQTTPMLVEIPEETHQMAARQAADMLASGKEIMPENFA